MSHPRSLSVGLLLLLAVPLAAQETRQVRRIERPAAKAPLYEGPAIPLPARSDCEQAVRDIAADYRPGGDLDPWLAADFPYREELLQALERVAFRATGVVLQVQSVERIEIEPWRLDGPPSKEAAQPIVSDCLADVRTRLTFEDPSTGLRTVRDVGRSRWRIEYRHEAAP